MRKRESERRLIRGGNGCNPVEIGKDQNQHPRPAVSSALFVISVLHRGKDGGSRRFCCESEAYKVFPFSWLGAKTLPLSLWLGWRVEMQQMAQPDFPGGALRVGSLLLYCVLSTCLWQESFPGIRLPEDKFTEHNGI